MMKTFVLACLVGLAVALLLVGVVSGTLLRHAVQIVPIVLALIVVRRSPVWGAYAALPIFMFWMAIAILIWLFLLGLSGFASGHYTPVEIACTVVMAGCSLVGTVNCFTLGRSLPAVRRVAAFLLFTTFQLAAMWVSFRGAIENR
jgi:hypothetical protein